MGCRTWLISILTAASVGAAAVAGDSVGAQASSKLTVSVVRQDGSEQQVTEAELQVLRSSIYVGKSGRFPSTTLGITAPITPPAGVKLTPRPVDLSTIQKIEWAPSTKKDATEPTPVTITYRDGKSETALLWSTDGSPIYNTLGLSTLSVKGTLNLQGQRVEATVGGPFKSMSFTVSR
jgi:hypothetical protein